MMASRFIATTDCDVHENIKKEIIRRQENETTLICKTIGQQRQGAEEQIISEVLAAEEAGKGSEELIPLIAGQRIKRAWETGRRG
jgi:nitronate monooxygenase